MSANENVPIHPSTQKKDPVALSSSKGQALPGTLDQSNNQGGNMITKVIKFVLGILNTLFGKHIAAPESVQSFMKGRDEDTYIIVEDVRHVNRHEDTEAGAFARLAMSSGLSESIVMNTFADNWENGFSSWLDADLDWTEKSKTFVALVVSDIGEVKDHIVIDPSEWVVHMAWVPKELGVTMVFVRPEDRVLAESIIKVGDKSGLEMCQEMRKWIDMSFQLPVLFGVVMTLIQTVTNSTKLHPMDFIGRQVMSEELIDISVQAEKAYKRLATLNRVGLVNEVFEGQIVSHLISEDDVAAAQEMLPGVSAKDLNFMKALHHDGAVFVSKRFMKQVRKSLLARLDREGFSADDQKRMIKKFDTAATYQLRMTGSGMVDINGNVMEGHFKTHIMRAGHFLERKMAKEGIDIFGLDESFKTDFSIVGPEGHIAMLVDAKLAKEGDLSSQFANAIDIKAFGNLFAGPVVKKFRADVNAGVLNLTGEELNKAAADQIINAQADEAGDFTRKNSDVLAVLAMAGMDVRTSPLAEYTVRTNALSSLATFSAVDGSKNVDMTAKGFGRRITLPIPAVRLQVFPRAYMVLGGYDMPFIANGAIEMMTLGKGIEGTIAVVSDETWEMVYTNTGGPDLDDFWEVMLYTNQNGKVRAKLQRNPAVWGEYVLLDPQWSVFDAMEEILNEWINYDLPILDETMLPKPIDKVEAMTLEEYYISFMDQNNAYATFDKRGQVQAQRLAMEDYIKVLVKNWLNWLYKESKDENIIELPLMALMGPNGNFRNAPMFNSIVTLFGKNKDDAYKAQLKKLFNTQVNLVKTKANEAEDKTDKVKILKSGKSGTQILREFMNLESKRVNRLIMEKTYHSHGIVLTGADGQKVYDGTENGLTSQVRPAELHMSIEDISEVIDSLDSSMAVRGKHHVYTMTQGLGDLPLGRVVENTYVSKHVPAASALAVLYNNLYAGKVQDMGKEYSVYHVQKSHEAWMEAFEIIGIDNEDEDSILDFIIALWYSLRAIPVMKRGPKGLNDQLKSKIGRPFNAETEKLLFSSPLSKWGVKRINLVAEAAKRLAEMEDALNTLEGMGVEVNEGVDFVPVVIEGGKIIFIKK